MSHSGNPFSSIATRLVVPLSIVAALLAILPAAALATPASQTLSGEAIAGPTPDSTGYSEISLDATLTNKVASGQLDTSGILTNAANENFNFFEGTVTCMIVQGPRVFVGAFGKAGNSKREFDEATNEVVRRITFFPGNYAQVAVVEWGAFEGALGGSYRHAFESLGEHHEGVSSGVAPNCKEFRHLRGTAEGEDGDTLSLSPSIAKPKDKSKAKSTTVKLGGNGEPSTTLKLYEPAHKAKSTTVAVNSHGKWSLTLTGLTAGVHEFVAVETAGAMASSNTVAFTVP